MAVSAIIASLLAVAPGDARPRSLATTAPETFLLGARTAVERWGGAIEWRSDGSLCACLHGADAVALAATSARCALSLRALVDGAIALAVESSDNEAIAVARATELLARGPDAIHIDETTAALLDGGVFELVVEGEQHRLRSARAIGDRHGSRALGEGDILGRYVIEGLLGHGGMGMVYRARDARLGRAVALKLLAPGRGTSDAAARLVREARAAASFTHPNVVAVHDVGEEGGVPWVAMELIEGCSLRDLVGDPSIEWPERLRHLLDVARALAAGHRAGLVHRDVKPENVMIRNDGVVKVLDYGIARRIEGDVAAEIGELATLTGEGMILGTPLYMAPEQMRGDTIDARVDQFAWGVTAYELLSGRRPWGVAGDIQALARMLTTSAEPLGPLMPALPEEVASAIDRTLARDAAARFSSMSEVIEVLERWVENRSSFRPAATSPTPSPSPPTATPSARRWWRWGATVLAFGAVLSVGVYASRRKVTPSSKLELPAKAASSTPPTSAGLSEAIRTWADGSTVPARRALEALVAKDASAADAWLRLAIWADDLAAGRAAFQHALRLREQLNERDRALLDAFEPRHRSPPDAAEWDARLSRLAEQLPSDAEVRIWLARAKRMRGDYNVAASLLERTAKEDHEMAGAALAQLGDLARHLNRPKDALAAYDRCVGLAPSAIDCWAGRARVRNTVGDCSGMESDARQWALLDPLDAGAEETIATVLFARGVPMAAVREAFRAKAEKVPSSQRAAVEQADAYRVAMAEGDFVRARALAETAATALPAGAGFFPHFQAAVDVMLAMNESGAIYESGVYALEFVHRARAWSPESVPQAAYPMLMLGRAYTGGAISRNEFVAERAEMLVLAEAVWERAGKPRDSYQRSVIWIGANGLASFTEEDVKDAVASLPSYQPLPSPGAIGPEIDGILGTFYRSANRPDEAITHLRVITDSCNALVFPYGWVWGHLELGRAFEMKKAWKEAAAAYRVVIDLWGAARPRSVSAEFARTRLAAVEAKASTKAP
jgi:serine/threonine protein kinase/tetratricopeptide (TPR) repeat protein